MRRPSEGEITGWVTTVAGSSGTIKINKSLLVKFAFSL